MIATATTLMSTSRAVFDAVVMVRPTYWRMNPMALNPPMSQMIGSLKIVADSFLRTSTTASVIAVATTNLSQRNRTSLPMNSRPHFVPGNEVPQTRLAKTVRSIASALFLEAIGR
jgi:hypothetical protein